MRAGALELMSPSSSTTAPAPAIRGPSLPAAIRSSLSRHKMNLSAADWKLSSDRCERLSLLILNSLTDRIVTIAFTSRRPGRAAAIAMALYATSGCGGGDAATPMSSSPAGVVAPCSDGYGSPADRAAIESAMLVGTASDVRSAIDGARTTRGVRMGCPESDPSRSAPDTTAPTLSQLAAHWNSVHGPAVAQYRIQCPELGRGPGSAALGAWFAKRAGGNTSANALTDIARMMEAQQFTAERSSPVVDTTYGVYGGMVSSGVLDSCSLSGKPDQQVSSWCATFPAQCPQYSSGLFAGRRFLVADVNRAANVIDGGAAFDQGWAGVMMIEAAIAEPDPVLRAKFEASARLAGQWSAAEPPVRNHNYTAKNIWLLARLYAWTGDSGYRVAMLDKLERNLLMGVLMDANGDGLNDAPGPPVGFAQLASVAQVPGRMWDAHNSVTHYQGMNTVAMVEAYVALRDRGDTLDAAHLRPFALAMLDNLAHDFLVLGVPSGAGQREAGFALALGQWKIANLEAVARPGWERSLAAIFNAGASSSAGAGTAFAGAYFAARSGIRY